MKGSFAFRCYGLLSFVLMLTVLSCQDPITVGNDLLDDNRIELGILDSTRLKTYTVPAGRFITHDPFLDPVIYYLGSMSDNLYGKTKAELFINCQMRTGLFPDYGKESALKFDSLVLVLTYDTLGTYAASTALQKIDVYRLDEKYMWKDTFYSDTTLAVFPDPVGSRTTTVRPKDSVTVTNHITRKSEKLLPQLRIRLNDDFGKSLIENFEAAKNDTLFGDFLKGFKITSESPEGKSFLYGLDLSDNAMLNTTSNKLIMYYNVASADTTLRKTYTYELGAATINRVVQDRSGSIVETFINNPTLGDSIAFVQSLGGTRTVVDLSQVRKLDLAKINKAELDVTVAILNEPGSNYKLTPYLAARYFDKNGRQLFISDISQSLTTTGSLYSIIGGQLNSSSGRNKYKLNITNHVKRMIADTTLSTDIQLAIIPEAETPFRMAVCGAKHSTNPMKLIITYTK